MTVQVYPSDTGMQGVAAGRLVPTKRIFSMRTPVRIEFSDRPALTSAIMKGGPWHMFHVGWFFNLDDRCMFTLSYPLQRPWQFWRLMFTSILSIHAADGALLGEIRDAYKPERVLWVDGAPYPPEYAAGRSACYAAKDYTIRIPGNGNQEAEFSVQREDLLLPVVAYAFYIWWTGRGS